MGVNDPRFDYDPVTLACKGLLIEEQRTNLLTYSEDLSNYQAINNATVLTDATAAPDSTTTADSLTATISGTSNTCWVQKLATIVASTSPYTASIYVKQGTSATVAINLALSGGTYQEIFATLTFNTANLVLSGGMVGTATGTLQEISGGWYRITVSFNNNGTNTVAALREYVTATTGSTVGLYTYFWGAQLEAGAFPTSYIPTTTTALTRAADVATMTGANFSNWYNQTEGTVFAAASSNKPSGSAPIVSIQISGGSSRHQVLIYTNVAATVDASIVQANIGVNTLSSIKTAYAYKANDFAVSVNGGVAATDTLGTVPPLAYATLGKFDFGGGESLNGHISRISYYPRRLPNSELQAITS
jgi:hypothetical protein